MKITEYIEKEKLKEALCPYSDTNYAQDMETILRIVDEFPAADVAPVVHGRWVRVTVPLRKGKYVLECSHCKQQVKPLNGELIYCPVCGAKMDLK